METEEMDVCGCLVFIKPNKPVSATSSKYLLRFGDVVRIGSKEGDDIRLKHLTDKKTDAVLTITEDTGFVQATNPEYAETALNDTRLSAPKYLLPGDQLKIKGKIFMYDAHLSTEDVATLKQKNQDGSVRQVPKKRHSVMMYSIANSLKKHKNEALPVPEPPVYVRDGFEFQAEYLPSPLTPSKTNYVATPPRLRKLSVTIELPKTANNILAKRRSSLRRYSIDGSSRALRSPFLRLRRSYIPSPKQALKAMTNENLIEWTTPPMSMINTSLQSGRRSSVAGIGARRSLRKSTVNKSFIAVRKSENSMVEESCSSLAGRRSSVTTRWSTSDQNDDIPEEDDEVFVDSSRLSTSYEYGKPSPVEPTRKSRISSQNKSLNKAGVIIVEDTPQVVSVVSRTGRKSTGKNTFVESQASNHGRQSTASMISKKLWTNETTPSEGESDDEELVSGKDLEETSNLPMSGRKSGFQKSKEDSQFYEDNSLIDQAEGEFNPDESVVFVSGGKRKSAISFGSSLSHNLTSEDLDLSAFDASSLAENSKLARKYVRYPRSTFSKTCTDFEKPEKSIGRRSAPSLSDVSSVAGRLSSKSVICLDESQDCDEEESPNKGRKSTQSTSTPLVGRQSIGRRSTTSKIVGLHAVTKDLNTETLADEDLTGIISPVLGRRSTHSRRSAKSEIHPSNDTEECFEESVGLSESYEPSSDYNDSRIEQAGSARRTSLYKNVLCKTLNESKQQTIGQKSAPARSGSNSEVIDLDMSNVGSSTADRRSAMSRRSKRSGIGKSDQSRDQVEPADESVFEEESTDRRSSYSQNAVCKTSVDRRSTLSRRSNRSAIEGSNQSVDQVEPADESVFEEESTDRRSSYSQNAVSKTPVDRRSTLSRRSNRSAIEQPHQSMDQVEPANESAFEELTERSSCSQNSISTTPVDRRSTMSRRSNKSAIDESNVSRDQVEPADESVFEKEVTDRRSSYSQNAVGKTPVDRRSTMSRRSNRSAIEEPNQSMDQVEPADESVFEEEVTDSQSSYSQNAVSKTPVDRRSTMSRKSNRSAIEGSNQSMDQVETADESVFEEESTDRRSSYSQSAVSKTPVDRRSTMSRRSNRSAIEGSNQSVDQVEPADESVFEEESTDRRSSYSQNAVSKTPVDRRSTMSRKSNRSAIEGSNQSMDQVETAGESVFEEESTDRRSSYSQSAVSKTPVDRRSTMSRRSNRSAIEQPNPSMDQVEPADESVFEEELTERSSCSQNSVSKTPVDRRSTMSRISNKSAIDELNVSRNQVEPADESVFEKEVTDRRSSYSQNALGRIPVDRRSTMSRRSNRCAIEEPNQSMDQVEPDESVFEEEVTDTQSSYSGIAVSKTPVDRRSTMSRRSNRSAIEESNQSMDHVETADESVFEEVTDRRSYSRNAVGKTPVDRRSTMSRRSNKSAIDKSNLSRDQVEPADKSVFEEELTDSQSSYSRNAVGKTPVDRRSTMSRRSNKSAIDESNLSRDQVEPADKSVFEEEVTDSQSSYSQNAVSKTPVDRRSTMSRRSNKSAIDESNQSRGQVEPADEFVFEEEVTDSQPCYSQNPVNKTPVDRRSTMSRRSNRSVIEGSNQSMDQVEPADDSAEEVTDTQSSHSGIAVSKTPVDRRSTMSRRSNRSVIEGSNQSMDQVEPADKSVFEEVTVRRPSHSQNALSKTLNDVETQSHRNLSAGRKSAPSKISRSERILDIINVASPRANRSSVSRRSTKSIFEESIEIKSEAVDESMFEEEVFGRQPSLSRNILSKTLNEVQSPRNIAVGRKSAPSKITRSDKIFEILKVASPSADRRSKSSRRTTRSLINTPEKRIENYLKEKVLEVFLDQEESPRRSIGSASIMGSRGSPVPSTIGSQSTNGSSRRSTRNQFVKQECSSTLKSSTNPSIEDEEENRPESPVLSSGRFQSPGSSSPSKIRQLRENILMGSPDLRANGRSSLKLPQYDDVTMEEEDVEVANNNSDQENSEDEVNMSGISRLQKSPNNDLTDVSGVKHLFTGPTKTPKLDGVKAIFNHERSPKNDLSDIKGVKQLFTAKSPLNDLSNIATGCVKQVFRVSPYNSYSQVDNIKDVFRRSPRNELTNFGGVKGIFKNNVPRQMPDTPDLQQVQMFKTPKNLRKTATTSIADEQSEESIPSPKGAMPSNDSFDSLLGRQAFRTYKAKATQHSPLSVNRKIMNDSLSETFDSIKKKRRMAKTPKPTLLEVLGADVSARDLEETVEVLPRLSLDLFNAKESEVKIDEDPLDVTPAKIIKNTSTPLPTSRTRSRRILMASVEVKDQSVAKDEQPREEKPKRNTRRNLSNKTSLEEKPAPRTRRNFASTDTPNESTQSQTGMKMEGVINDETSRSGRGKRNQGKNLLIEEKETNLEPPETSEVSENVRPTRGRRNAKKVDKVDKAEASNTHVITGKEKVTTEESSEELSVVEKGEASKTNVGLGNGEVTTEEFREEIPVMKKPATRSKRGARKVVKEEETISSDDLTEDTPAEKPTRSRRNVKKVDKVKEEEDSIQKSPAVTTKLIRGRRNAKKKLDEDLEQVPVAKDEPTNEEIPLPEPVNKAPAVAATRGRRKGKKNLEEDVEQVPVAKDEPPNKEIPLPKQEPVKKSPAVAAKRTRGRKNNKKDFEEDLEQGPAAKDEPPKEEIPLPKQEPVKKSPAVAAKRTRGRKNSKKDFEEDLEQGPVVKDETPKEEIPLPKQEPVKKSPAVAAKRTRGRKNSKKDFEEDLEHGPAAKDEPPKEEIPLPKQEPVKKSPAVAAKPIRGRRNGKKNLEEDTEQAPQVEAVQETVAQPKPARGKRNAKKVDTNEKESPNHDDLELGKAGEQPTVTIDEPRSTRSTRAPSKRGIRNVNKLEAKEDIETEKEIKPLRGKKNAKDTEVEIVVLEEVEEKKTVCKQTNRHVRFDEKNKDEGDSKDNEEDYAEEEKPTRGKRALSKKVTAVKPEAVQTSEEMEEEVLATRVTRGRKRNAGKDDVEITEEVENNPAKRGKTAKKDTETVAVKKSSKRTQNEEVVETARKSKRLRK